MPTRTSPRTTRPGRSAGTSSGRFARSTGAPRRGAPPRRYGMASGVLQRRRTPQPTGLKAALGGLGGLGTKATPSSKKGKAGGFALVAAAAGFLFSNRDKLAGRAKKRGSQADAPTPPPASSQ